MSRKLAAIVLACSLSTVAYSQDSGPGPDPAGMDTEKQYDVTLYQRATTTDGTLLFFAASDTSSAYTSGDFESNINGEQLTGTWHAYDLGSYAFWFAHASGDTNSLSALGWATPDFVVGRATMNAGGRSWSFFRWFSRNVVLPPRQRGRRRLVVHGKNRSDHIRTTVEVAWYSPKTCRAAQSVPTTNQRVTLVNNPPI